MWDRWRNWAKQYGISFFQSAEWAETLVHHYPFYRPEPIDSDDCFLPLLRQRRFGWLSDSLYGMPFMSTGGLLTSEENRSGAWATVSGQIKKKQVGSIVLCLPPQSPPPPELQGFEVIEQATHLIDLSEGWETTHSRFNKSCKEAIRRAERLGVQVAREENEAGVEDHWALISQQFEKWKPNPALTRAFIHDLVRLPQSRLYLARVEERAVLSMLAFEFGGEIFLWQSAKTQQDFPPGTSNLLTSTLFREASEAGTEAANFGSSLGNPKIERYKEAYGAVKTPYLILKKKNPILGLIR